MHRQVTPPRFQRTYLIAISTTMGLLALFGCGGHAAEQLPTSRSGSSSTNADTDLAGAAGSSGTDGIGGTMSTAQGGEDMAAGGKSGSATMTIDRAVCEEFSPLWQRRANATTSDCDFCLEYGRCDFPRNGDCVAGTNCVDRHCATLTDGAALCDCVESCFSATLASCNQRWSTFMSCAAKECAVECG
jgi:hypothetical protein